MPFNNQYIPTLSVNNHSRTNCYIITDLIKAQNKIEFKIQGSSSQQHTLKLRSQVAEDTPTANRGQRMSVRTGFTQVLFSHTLHKPEELTG